MIFEYLFDLLKYPGHNQLFLILEKKNSVIAV